MMIDANGDIRIDCKHRPRGNVLVELCEHLALQLQTDFGFPGVPEITGEHVLNAIESFERREQ